mgnify:CR=1 FL=1
MVEWERIGLLVILSKELLWIRCLSMLTESCSCGRTWYTGSAVSLDVEQSKFCSSAYFLAPFLDPQSLNLYEDTLIEVMVNDCSYTWQTLQLERITKMPPVTRAIHHLTKASSKWKLGWLLEHGESRLDAMKQEQSKQNENMISSPFFSAISPPTVAQIEQSRIDQVAFFTLAKYTGNSTHNREISGEIDLLQGQQVSVVGTPFGVNSPMTFYNSITRGYISNTICNTSIMGSHAADLWLVDTTLSPGMEGGALCNDGLIKGMLLPPIRRSDDIVAFNLAVPFRHILESSPLSSRNPVLSHVTQIGDDKAAIQKAKRSVVLLKNGATWTSGFFISQEGRK